MKKSNFKFALPALVVVPMALFAFKPAGAEMASSKLNDTYLSGAKISNYDINEESLLRAGGTIINDNGISNFAEEAKHVRTKTLFALLAETSMEEETQISALLAGYE